MASPSPTTQIGDLATRTGVSVHVLRAWERRYGLLVPGRSSGGYRLYSPQDEWRVREMVRLRDQGIPTAQAAAAALAGTRGAVPAPATPRPAVDAQETSPGPGVSDEQVLAVRDRLLTAAAAFDGRTVHALLDAAIEQFGVESMICDVVLPVLHETGERWQRGELTIAQEHHTSNLIRSRLAVLTLTWDAGTGPVAVLACPAGELHDIGLLAFGVIIGRAGWRVHYLGANTPTATLGTAAEVLNPDLVILSAVSAEPIAAMAEELAELPRRSSAALAAARIVIAGAGATPEAAARLGATLLAADPGTAARQVAEQRRRAGHSR